MLVPRIGDDPSDSAITGFRRFCVDNLANGLLALSVGKSFEPIPNAIYCQSLPKIFRNVNAPWLSVQSERDRNLYAYGNAGGASMLLAKREHEDPSIRRDRAPVRITVQGYDNLCTLTTA